MCNDVENTQGCCGQDVCTVRSPQRQDSTGVVQTEDGPAIQLVNGRYFHFLNPDPDSFDIETIASALSRLCRFTGHSKHFYSVAQHSVLVSRLLEDHGHPDLALDGLLHDASEAFVGDLSRPLKVVLDQLAPGVWRKLEERIHQVIAKKFGTTYPHPQDIKRFDMVALATEREFVMPPGTNWPGLPDPDHGQAWAVVQWAPGSARFFFMQRFREVTR